MITIFQPCGSDCMKHNGTGWTVTAYALYDAEALKKIFSRALAFPYGLLLILS